MINIDRIYELMTKKGFQDPRSGNLFFPVYIYTYQAEHEYDFRKKVQLLSKKLKKPNHYLDCMLINIYEEIIEFLKEQKFTGKSIFESILEKEKEDPEAANKWVSDLIGGDSFETHFVNKVRSHFDLKEDKRVFLIIHGFGSSFPYLRASDLLTRMEKIVKDFKVILFYPGAYKERKFKLFDQLETDNVYRANNLNLLLGEE